MRFCMVALQSPFQIAQHQIQMRDEITLLQTLFYSVFILHMRGECHYIYTDNFIVVFIQ